MSTDKPGPRPSPYGPKLMMLAMQARQFLDAASLFTPALPAVRQGDDATQTVLLPPCYFLGHPVEDWAAGRTIEYARDVATILADLGEPGPGWIADPIMNLAWPACLALRAVFLPAADRDWGVRRTLVDGERAGPYEFDLAGGRPPCTLGRAHREAIDRAVSALERAVTGRVSLVEMEGVALTPLGVATIRRATHDRFNLDPATSTVTLDGKPFELDKVSFLFVRALVEAKGEWVSGRSMMRDIEGLASFNSSKTYEKLPPEIRRLIAHESRGYRLKPAE